MEDAAYRGGHLLGLRVPASVDVGAVADRLREQRVHVSVRGTAIRVSPHVYNDARDIEALLDALRRARPSSEP